MAPASARVDHFRGQGLEPGGGLRAFQVRSGKITVGPAGQRTGRRFYPASPEDDGPSPSLAPIALRICCRNLSSTDKFPAWSS
jgi:hypothetical protein